MARPRPSSGNGRVGEGSEGWFRQAWGDNASEVIQGDLVGSSGFCGDDDGHDVCVWPVVQVWPGRSDRPGEVGRAITRAGKASLMAGEESDEFVVVLKAG